MKGALDRSHDVIVIGAGIIGCAVGRELARRGAKVRIFEARTVGAGATRASAGVLGARTSKRTNVKRYWR